MIRLIKLWVTYFVINVLVTSCYSNTISKHYKPAEQQTKGLLILSAYSKMSSNVFENINGFTFTLHRKVAGTMQKVELGHLCMKYGHDWPREFTPGSDLGCVNAYELPPGEYAITDYQLQGGGGWTKNIDPINIPFTLTAGKSTYIGSLYFESTNFSQRHTTGEVSIRLARIDRRERDFPVFLSRFANIREDQIEIDKNLESR